MLQLLRAQAVTGDPTPLIGFYLRVVNLPGLMSDLRPYVKARLTKEQRRGLRFEQEGDRCVIVRAQERLELDTLGVLTRMYSSAATTPLVMGSVYADGYVGSPAVTGAPGQLAEITSALFPPLYPAAPSFLPGLNYR